MTYHQFHPSILRLNDIRGQVGVTLFEKDAEVLGQCLGTILHGLTGCGKIVVGYDGRIHAQGLAQALIKGLRSTGQGVLSVGMGPTPMIYFAEQHYHAQGAIVVTGSHNPSEFNGFKMSLQGKILKENDIQALGKMSRAGLFSKGDGLFQENDVQEAYVATLMKDFNTYYATARPLKIAWDPGNGATGNVLKMLLDTLPGTHHIINQEVDGRFPAHHPDPTIPENLVQLCALVQEKQCDLGVGFDGDGDRIGVLDNQGRILWGDQLLLLYAQEVLKNFPGSPVISDVKASQKLFDAIEALGGKPVMWFTGHAMIKDKMAQMKAPLAGEVSGHMFFSDRYFGFDDALYAALRLIGALGQKTERLAQWRQCFPHVINTPEIRVPCDDDKKFKIIEEVKRRVRLSHDKIIDIDGVRVIYPHGWWLLRASNTQNVMVIRIEANTQDNLVALQKDLQHQLSYSGITIPISEQVKDA